MNISGGIQRALYRVGSAALAFAVGGVYGMLGTIAHQATLSVLGVAVPWAIVVASAAVVSLLVGLRMVANDRLMVLAAGLGVLGMIGLLSLKSFGGSILVPNNGLGIAWTATPTLLAMIVVVWPRLLPRKMKPGS